jgi:ABC-type transporter Mla MlaB component
MDARAGAATFVVRGPIRPEDLAGLSVRVCRIVRAHPGAVLTCDVASVAADAGTVDALARLALVARRHGSRVRLVSCAPDLLDLLTLMGLDDVLTGERVSRPAGAADRTAGTTTASPERR